MAHLTRRRAMAVLGTLAGVATACATAAPPERGEDEPMRFSYGDDPSQYAELTLPEGVAAAPVVVVVHGGYWTSSYGAELGRPLAADLAGRGFAALNVEYRRVGSGGGWPQTGDDVAAALDGLADRADGLDLNHVVGLGHSAGGQLAGWLAARRGGRVTMTGAVLQAGVLDLVRGSADGLGAGAVDAFLGGSPSQRPEAYAQASPFARLPLGVPTVAVHGTRDANVPIDQSERFVAAAVRAGDRSELRTFDGDHFDPITVGTQAWDLCVEALHQRT
ncbi:alpha/beta hydrolase family protein [Mycolicibacterium sediminis]|uniref:Putative lipase/esterase n=1 Tax=Mycolicibacterium sediminis TaxID=1286180 RepID=A0A7I7QN11_9MYCO|nr:prolyl oligopeptidase family serine peptidase [Mycolicibacterium sediminis]BBY27711.1 putative lipase/esterase [Mycolicibacterium sediminis]